jgi:hypothetical protein
MRRAQKLLERMQGIWGRIGRGGKRVAEEVPQGCRSVRKTLAERLADRAQSLPSSQRPNTIAVIRHSDGKITIGRNQGGVNNSIVKEALSNAPANCFAGQCAEINALSRALNKGRSLDGATIEVLNVRGPLSTSGVHGTPKVPCIACSSVLEQLGINYIP